MGLAMYHVGFFQLDMKSEASFIENSVGFGLRFVFFFLLFFSFFFLSLF